MKFFACCFTLATAASFLSLAQTQSPEPPPPSSSTKFVEVPLLDCSGLPCIDMATGSGKTLRLLIDTGDVNSYLSTQTAQSLSLQQQPMQGSNGAAIDQIQQTTVPGAHIGDLPMGDFPFMVIDTKPDPTLAKQQPVALPGDGVLAYSAFQNRILEIDYPHHILRLSEPQSDAAPCPQTCSKLVIRHFGNFGPVTLCAKDFTVNGQPVEAQIDTLFTGTMLVYPSSVEKLGLKKLSKAKPKEFFPYTQNGLRLVRAQADSEGFEKLTLMQDAPLYFVAADERLPDTYFDVTVGSGLLNRAAVTIDFKGMQMWLDVPPTDMPAMPLNPK